jgi:small GTP-binding protein
LAIQVSILKILHKKLCYNSKAVGKSNILSRYAKNTFKPNHEITIGCEFMAKNIQLKDKIIRIQIWDTAGQESFRSITRSYYKNSTCAFIVYDITFKKTFDNVIIWLNECRDMCYKNILICLIGNKIDLEDKREVTFEDGENFAKENNLLFFETSAKNGNNINEIFLESAKILMNKIEKGEILIENNNTGIKIGNSENNEDMIIRKKEGCC